jgi:uncharacterized membrane protein
MKLRVSIPSISAAVLAGGASAQTITNLGELFGGSPANRAATVTALSPDGAALAGYRLTSQGARAFRWSEALGMQDLGLLYNATDAWPSGISTGGSVVAGFALDPFGNRAFRWTPAGLVNIGGYEGTSVAVAVSADGSVVVGGRRAPATSNLGQAFRWTLAGGMEDLGRLFPNGDSGATDVSLDGNVVTGRSGNRAFRWTAATGMQDLGAPDWPGVLFDSVSIRPNGGSTYFSDDFDSYPTGAFPCVGGGCAGPAGWSVWASGGEPGRIVSGNAHSGTKALRVSPGTDVVQTALLTSGQWTVTTQTYFPSTMPRPGYFIVMHAYNGVPAGATSSWAIILRLDPQSGQVFDDVNGHYPYGPPVAVAALVRDQWAEVRAEIDLDANTYDLYYAGERVITGRTYAPAGSSPAGPAIACLDLYSPAFAIDTEAYAISADGSTIVGSASNVYNAGRDAFRWTQEAGMENLGALPGGWYATARVVSSDGSLVFGMSNVSPGIEHPFAWTRQLGMLGLGDYLTMRGVNLAGWDLWGVEAISADGSAIMGNGSFEGQPRAWLVRLSSECFVNCDGSTILPILNVADFTCFLQRFAAGESYANCDQSTAAPVLNVADFTCFLQRFAAGCP